ncbi:MAG: hypothetical protein HUJ54_02590 [Erysipelotrichaceae bacterium]|nr:hypothetical protein [Erysipelotrichaceae bacterium]
MNSYYQSVISQLVDLFSRQEYDQISRIIDNELSMPYVDAQAQEILEQYREDLKPHLAKSRQVSDEEIEQWVSGSERQQEMAAGALQKMNMRQYTDLIQKLLDSEQLLDEFKGELIEAMMEQKLDEEFKIVKNGMEIEFVPSLITPVSQDPVLKEADSILERWLSCDNPSMLSFCRQLLEQEVLEMRPMDFEGIAPQKLAASLVRLVYQAMKDEDGWNQFAKDHQLEDTEAYPLLIEKRGD